jgi:hypothetical protein
MMMTARNVAVLGSLLFLGCGDSNSTTPTSTTPTVVAPPSVTESFSGALAVGASKFYSFSVAANGTVNLTLTTLIANGQDSATPVALALGAPGGTACQANTTVTIAAGATPQITGTYPAGVYCAMISDVGNLSSPSTFTIAIAHP